GLAALGEGDDAGVPDALSALGGRGDLGMGTPFGSRPVLPCPRRRRGSSVLTARPFSMLDTTMREAIGEQPTIFTRPDGRVTVVTLSRPERRNAVDLF